MSELTFQQARAAVDAALAKAQDLGVSTNIAVVDAGANLKAFARMDGALLGSIDVAIRKARTGRSSCTSRRCWSSSAIMRGATT